MPDPRDDIDRWVDALAGRQPRGDSKPSPDERDAMALRAAILQSAPVEPESQPPADPRGLEHEWQRLAFRLRREGVLGARPPMQARWLPASVAAAVVATVALTLVMQRPDDPDFPLTYGEAPVLRGATPVITSAVPDPARAARRLAVAARPLNASPVIYASGDKAVVDMDVNPENLRALTTVLRDNGVPAGPIPPNARVLRVVFERAPAK